MKTKTDLENKVWYRLTKVAYIMFALLVLWVSVVSLVGEWDHDKIFVYSDKQVKEIKSWVNEKSENNWFKLDTSNMEQEKSNITPGISEDDKAMLINQMLDEWKYSDDEIINAVAKLDTEEEQKKRISFNQKYEIAKKLDAFINNPSESQMRELRMAIYSKWIDTPDNTLIYSWKPSSLYFQYLFSQLPFWLFVISIELIILFIIPRIFFYITLWKQY